MPPLRLPEREHRRLPGPDDRNDCSHQRHVRIPEWSFFQVLSHISDVVELSRNGCWADAHMPGNSGHGQPLLQYGLGFQPVRENFERGAALTAGHGTQVNYSHDFGKPRLFKCQSAQG